MVILYSEFRPEKFAAGPLVVFAEGLPESEVCSQLILRQPAGVDVFAVAADTTKLDLKPKAVVDVFVVAAAAAAVLSKELAPYSEQHAPELTETSLSSSLVTSPA